MILISLSPLGTPFFKWKNFVFWESPWVNGIRTHIILFIRILSYRNFTFSQGFFIWYCLIYLITIYFWWNFMLLSLEFHNFIQIDEFLLCFEVFRIIFFTKIIHHWGSTKLLHVLNLCFSDKIVWRMFNFMICRNTTDVLSLIERINLIVFIYNEQTAILSLIFLHKITKFYLCSAILYTFLCIFFLTYRSTLNINTF